MITIYYTTRFHTDQYFNGHRTNRPLCPRGRDGTKKERNFRNYKESYSTTYRSINPQTSFTYDQVEVLSPFPPLASSCPPRETNRNLDRNSSTHITPNFSDSVRRDPEPVLTAPTDLRTHVLTYDNTPSVPGSRVQRYPVFYFILGPLPLTPLLSRQTEDVPQESDFVKRGAKGRDGGGTVYPHLPLSTSLVHYSSFSRVHRQVHLSRVTIPSRGIDLGRYCVTTRNRLSNSSGLNSLGPFRLFYPVILIRLRTLRNKKGQ